MAHLRMHSRCAGGETKSASCGGEDNTDITQIDISQQLESLNAFRTLDKEMVLEAARAADKLRASGAPLGALHGLPIPVKDSFNSKALPTSYGTAAFRNFKPNNDAGVLKLLLAQGGILMGKTVVLSLHSESRKP